MYPRPTLITPFLFLVTISYSQPFHIVPLDSLCHSVDNYFQQNYEAQLLELKQTDKYRWVNYLPNPGFNPFTGGFAIQFNLSAPLAEFKSREALKQKQASLKKLSQLEAEKIKNMVRAQYLTITNAISEYQMQDSLFYLRDIAFNLFTTQYNRNEITPTEYLAKQQERQQYLLVRKKEANTISGAIRQLMLTAFYPFQ